MLISCHPMICLLEHAHISAKAQGQKLQQLQIMSCIRVRKPGPADIHVAWSKEGVNLSMRPRKDPQVQALTFVTRMRMANYTAYGSLQQQTVIENQTHLVLHQY